MNGNVTRKLLYSYLNKQNFFFTKMGNRAEQVLWGWGLVSVTERRIRGEGVGG
jgi:hypothetical protein